MSRKIVADCENTGKLYETFEMVKREELVVVDICCKTMELFVTLLFTF